MRAIVIEDGKLALRDVAKASLAPSHVRIRVRAAGVNRADLLQRRGMYPAPPDAPADIPGLEIAGEITEAASDVREHAVGDRVFAVVSGGGYAEEVVAHARTVARLPSLLDFAEGAATPEAFVTAYDAMVVQADLSAGDVVLVHAVGSGVGTAAVQIARAIGARSIGTARTPEKLARAKELGLAEGIVPEGDANAPRFAERVRSATGGRGADVALDLVGGAYVPETLASLVERGRAMLVGLVAGARAEIDLALVLRRRLRLQGTVLRARPLEEKILAAQLLAMRISPLLASGALVPVVDRTYPLEQAAEAMDYVASNAGFGKVVLTVG
jgi:putative PIG3 family NAD(P)H quinone oxidoreductase